MISDIIFAIGKGIMKQHTDLRSTQVQTVATALWSIHATFLSSVAIVEQLGRQAGQLRAALCVKEE